MPLVNQENIEDVIRDLKLQKRIAAFLSDKREQGLCATSRQVAAAIDVQRYIVVLMLARMAGAGQAIMLGEIQQDDGGYLPCYTVPPRTSEAAH